MPKPREKTLFVRGTLVSNGIQITVEKKDFVIEYPSEIWAQMPAAAKEVLLDNLTFGNTHFLPLTLGYSRIQYNTRFPVAESFLFRNQLLDMTKSEEWDNAPLLSYLKQFYNLEFDFALGSPVLPPAPQKPKTKQPVAIIPFSFGKESLATFALCRELGIKPVLVYSQEPSMAFEEVYKKEMLKKFSKEFGVDVYFAKNGPGLFRYDAAFKKKCGTEVGWGSQTTLLALQMLPFVYAYGAQYILFGSEYLSNEYHFNKGWKVFICYDQTSFYTQEQTAMIRLLTKDACTVKSSLEPIDQINIFDLLHRRYPEIGKYQFSCTAEAPLYKDSQWCHTCYKCSRMFLFARTVDIDPFSIGFKKDLLNEPGLFVNYFGKEHKSGSTHELDFCFYALAKKGVKSRYVEQFKKIKLKKMPPWKELYREFTTLRPSLNLPEAYQEKIFAIFQTELDGLKKILPHS